MSARRVLEANLSGIALFGVLCSSAYAQSADYSRLHQMLIDGFPAISKQMDAAAEADISGTPTYAEGGLLHAKPATGIDLPGAGDTGVSNPAAGDDAGRAFGPRPLSGVAPEMPPSHADTPDEVTGDTADFGAPTAGNDTKTLEPPPPDLADAQAAVGGPVAVQNRFLIQFKPDAEREQIQGVLERYDLSIIPPEENGNSVPEIGLLHVEQQPPADAAADAGPDNPKSLADILEPPIVLELRREESVRSALPEPTLTVQVLFRDGDTSGLDAAGAKHVWTWGQAAPGSLDGNWGLKNARFPAAWSILSRSLQRNPAAPSIVVGIFDVGFSNHPDLKLRMSSIAPISPHDHGNHVAGTVGATQGNGVGISGAALRCDLLVGQVEQIVVGEGQGNVSRLTVLGGNIVSTLTQMISRHPEMRLVNISLGFNWMRNASIDPGGPGADAVAARNTVRNYGSIVRSIVDMPAARDMVFVSAAGNDSRPSLAPDIEAQWSSPLNWAALNSGGFDKAAPNIIVVEAIDRAGRRASFSNIGGHVSAPGVGVLSTTTTGYGAMNGTSMASPHVSGLLANLFAYNPELTAAEAVRLTVETASRSTDKAAPHIDGMEALLRSSDQALTDLADLNGDGAVDKLDFGVFQTDLASVDSAGGTIDRDLNGDGIVDDLENAWPVIDLNGSGVASEDIADRRPVSGRLMSDLEVMRSAWTDDVIAFQEASGQTEQPVIPGDAVIADALISGQ